VSVSDDEFLEVRRAFREMQDEEPPAGGLADLMAAARAKAVEMAPAKAAEPERVPWWRALLRPPVLALASVVVLVGGALLIGRHDETKLAVEPMAGSAAAHAPSQDPGVASNGAAFGSAKPGVQLDEKQASDKPADVVAQQPSGAADQGGLANKNASVKTTTRTDTTNDRELSIPAPTSTPQGAPTNVPKPPPPRPVEDPAPAPKLEATGSSKKDAASPPGHAGRAGDASEADGLTNESRDEAPPATAPDARTIDRRAPTRAATGTRTPTTTDTPRATEEAAAEPKHVVKAPSVDQLVQQCRTAAARGDCPTVKVLAKTIERQNPSSYRDRVQTDESIARCLK